VVFSSLSSSLSSLPPPPPSVRGFSASRLIFLSLENYQKRQSNTIIAQNLAQPSTNVTNFSFNPAPNNVYVAPTVQVHQQFVRPQVTQVTYAAPGQFIPPDAHYGGNGGFHMQGQF